MGKERFKQSDHPGISGDSKTALMARMLELAPVAAMVNDFEGRLLFCNSRACEVHGYEAEEFAALTLRDLASPETRAAIPERLRVLREEGEISFEVDHIQKKGTWIPLEVISRTVDWEEEPAIFSIAVDISARKATEGMLDAERRQLISIFDSIDQVVYVTDPYTHEIIYVNRHFRDVLGTNPTGRRCYAEFQGLDAPCEFCTNEIILEDKGRPHSWEHYNEALKRHYWIIDRIIRWPDGRDVRFELAIDISEIKELERRLAVSQRMEAVGLLAGGIAHDFNNLLTVINNCATLAKKNLSDTKQVQEDIAQIQSAGQRAAALTRQLLAFSRKQVLQPKVINLNGVILDLEDMLRRLLGEDIDIEIHLDENLGHVLVDPSQMEQIIANLALNAREAMPGGGSLTIETINVKLDEEYARQHVDVSPGDYVMMCMTDTGHGMDEKTKSRIFEPFFSTKPRGRGTGLGLATVYGIVKQSGGDIWVYSEPNAGAAFKIYLPKVSDHPIREESSPSPVLNIGGGTETLLLVEDEDAVRFIAERLLCQAGYTVLTARDAEEAMRIHDKMEHEIDLLLTDVVMPKTSGRQLADKLLSLQPKLKVLYMSGYTDNAIVHHGVLNAGTHFIAKPFSATELTRKVREVLDGS